MNVESLKKKLHSQKVGSVHIEKKNLFKKNTINGGH